MTMTHGVGIYRFGDAPGTLDATWSASSMSSPAVGTGRATGGPEGRFAGAYKITYFEPDGRASETYDLDIIPNGDVYTLTWTLNGALRYTGVGMPDGDALVLCYVDPGNGESGGG